MDPATTAGGAIAAASAFERLGIVGVLFCALILVTIAALHFRKETIAAHARREKEVADAQTVAAELRDDLAQMKQMFLIVKLAADGKGAEYDLSEIGDLETLLYRKR